jgi:hypothetical protein
MLEEKEGEEEKREAEEEGRRTIVIYMGNMGREGILVKNSEPIAAGYGAVAGACTLRWTQRLV